jgi:hypothetical protein
VAAGSTAGVEGCGQVQVFTARKLRVAVAEQDRTSQGAEHAQAAEHVAMGFDGERGTEAVLAVGVVDGAHQSGDREVSAGQLCFAGQSSIVVLVDRGVADTGGGEQVPGAEVLAEGHFQVQGVGFQAGGHAEHVAGDDRGDVDASERRMGDAAKAVGRGTGLGGAGRLIVVPVAGSQADAGAVLVAQPDPGRESEVVVEFRVADRLEGSPVRLGDGEGRIAAELGPDEDKVEAGVEAASGLAAFDGVSVDGAEEGIFGVGDRGKEGQRPNQGGGERADWKWFDDERVGIPPG